MESGGEDKAAISSEPCMGIHRPTMLEVAQLVVRRTRRVRGGPAPGACSVSHAAQAGRAEGV